MGSQFDLGFDTGKKLWFIEASGPTRWKDSTLYVKDANINLDHVMCDGYGWGDPRSPDISHMRLRFYGGNKIESHGEESVLEEANITGPQNKFNFIEMKGNLVLIKAILPSMEWEIDVDGNKFITKDIKGPLSGTIMKNRLRFVLKNVRLLYSNLVTLIDPELNVKKKKSVILSPASLKEKNRCIKKDK